METDGEPHFNGQRCQGDPSKNNAFTKPFHMGIPAKKHTLVKGNTSIQGRKKKNHHYLETER